MHFTRFRLCRNAASKLSWRKRVKCIVLYVFKVLSNIEHFTPISFGHFVIVVTSPKIFVLLPGLEKCYYGVITFSREIGLTRGIQKLMPCFDFRWSPLMFDIEYCRHSIIKSRPICIWKLWDFCMLHSFKVHVVATTDHCALISRYRISRSKLGRLFINNEFESSSSKLVFVNKKKTFSSTRFFGLVKTFKLV